MHFGRYFYATTLAQLRMVRPTCNMGELSSRGFAKITTEGIESAYAGGNRLLKIYDILFLIEVYVF